MAMLPLFSLTPENHGVVGERFQWHYHCTAVAQFGFEAVAWVVLNNAHDRVGLCSLAVRLVRLAVV